MAGRGLRSAGVMGCPLTRCGRPRNPLRPAAAQLRSRIISQPRRWRCRCPQQALGQHVRSRKLLLDVPGIRNAATSLLARLLVQVCICLLRDSLHCPVSPQRACCKHLPVLSACAPKTQRDLQVLRVAQLSLRSMGSRTSLTAAVSAGGKRSAPLMMAAISKHAAQPSQQQTQHQQQTQLQPSPPVRQQ